MVLIRMEQWILLEPAYLDQHKSLRNFLVKGMTLLPLTYSRDSYSCEEQQTSL